MIDSNSQREQHRNVDDYVIVDPTPDLLGYPKIDVTNPPKVSFCIPTMNSEQTLASCLESIATQNYPETEIVVVDGGSSDRTVEIARNYTDNIKFDNGTLGSARQTSIDHSTGEVVALFDSDVVIPHRDWLRNAVHYFNYSERVSTVWPTMIAPPNASLTSRLYANLWKMSIENRIDKRHGVLGGGNALFLRSCIDRIGGVSRSLHWGEDFDWATKLRDQSYQVILIRDPLYHDTMRSFQQFTKKQFTGAQTFTKTGFGLQGISKSEVLNEQFILGGKSMIGGLFRDKDYSWALYPFFVFIRVVAYGTVYVKGIAKR